MGKVKLTMYTEKIDYYRIILYIILLSLAFNVIYLNLFKLDDFLQSDMVAEMNYIQMVWENKNLLPFEWVNSQELFINRPILITAVLYGISNNFILSYQLGIIITTILLCLSFAYLLKQLKLSYNNIILAIICFLGLYSIGSTINVLIIFLNAYSMFLIAIFITLGVYIKKNLNKECIKFEKIKITILYVIALIMGMSGPRLTLVLYIPLFLLEVFYWIKDVWETNRIYVKIKVKFNALSLLMCNMIGFFAYKVWIIKAIDHKDINNFSIFTVDRILENVVPNIEQLLRGIGIHGGVDLISFQGIDLGIKILVLSIAIILMIYILKNNKEFEIRYTIMFFIASIILVMVYMIVSVDVPTDRYYFINIAFLIIILVVGIQQLGTSKTIFSNIVKVILIVAVGINCIANFIPLYKTEGNTKQKEVAKYLVENNYELAYATYWNASIMKGLTNGKIETGHFMGDFTPFLWLTNKELYTKQPNNKDIAIILTDIEEQHILALNNNDTEILNGFEKVKEIEDYNIYKAEYNPVVQFWLPRKEDETQVYSFTERYAFKNVSEINRIEDYIISDNKEGFIVWGPYINTREGIYSFKLNYEVIENLDENIGYFDVSINNGTVQVGANTIDENSASVTIDNVKFENNTDIFECRVFINPGVSIKLKSIEITRK